MNLICEIGIIILKRFERVRPPSAGPLLSQGTIQNVKDRADPNGSMERIIPKERW